MLLGVTVAVITITDAPLAIADVLQVVSGASVELGPAARSRIRASREVVERLLDTGQPIYGLNTGVGHERDVRLPPGELRRVQHLLVMTHAGGLGPPLPTDLVRAALMVRLNGLARGGSGASPAVADTLAAMLNAGVHPVVPAGGSVGAGDLPQMATIAQVAIGSGRAEYHGEVLPGAEALARAGIQPLVLEPKDGLALISANGVSVGQGAIVVERAERLVRAADVAAALSLEATNGNPSIVLPAVGAAKPFDGLIETCRHLRAALAGSDLLRPEVAHSVQDPLSFRVAPQVHGALREYVASARRAVEIELNGQSDNPLVSVEDQAIIHNGNFHPIVLALAFDALRVAIAHVGQLSERRMNHLWDAFFARAAEHAASTFQGAVPELFGLSLRYPAASVVAELRQLATPATLDCPPLDMGVEDHATSAPLSVRKAAEALGLLEDVLAIELLLARDVLAAAPVKAGLGAGAEAALQAVEQAMASRAEERAPAEIHRAVRGALPDAVLAWGGRPDGFTRLGDPSEPFNTG